MKWREISLEQLEWLNRQYAQTARRMAHILKKLDDAKLAQDHAIYAAITSALHAVFTACEVTHAELERRRPPMDDPHKPGAQKRMMLEKEYQRRQRRAAIERGRVDPPKPTDYATGFEDTPY